MKKRARAEFEAPLVDTLVPEAEGSFDLLAMGPEAAGAAAPSGRFAEMWRGARAAADSEAFLHWEAAFPGVWRGWQEARPEGGFDAVIGNPPWERIKLQEVEWLATRDPEAAHLTTAAARKSRIRWLRDKRSPLAGEFDAAKARADRLGEVVRASGHYPMLGGGDINLYSLFVERAMQLVKPDGIVGLLTPSGIYADSTAARFFKSVSTAGRVAGLFDFENRRKIFFKDVHASFKFCALVFGGEERQFRETECAFFLHDTRTINDPDRCFPLAPSDFALVNPNTGTAPVFRSRRDAEITRRIYTAAPGAGGPLTREERKAWPVRYQTMFHMTNDSHLFRTASELQAGGYYPCKAIAGRRAMSCTCPCMKARWCGRSIIRASGTGQPGRELTIDLASRTGLDRRTRRPGFLPRPQYWVSPPATWRTLYRLPSDSMRLAFKDIHGPPMPNHDRFAASALEWLAVTQLPVLLPSEDRNALEASPVPGES